MNGGFHIVVVFLSFWFKIFSVLLNAAFITALALNVFFLHRL